MENVQNLNGFSLVLLAAIDQVFVFVIRTSAFDKNMRHLTVNWFLCH